MFELQFMSYKNRSIWTRAHLHMHVSKHMVPQRSKEYMNFEKCPQISENKLQWHYLKFHLCM